MNQLVFFKSQLNFFENSDSDDSEIIEFLFSDSSDDEDLVLNVNAIIQDDRSDLNKIPKVQNYVENIVNHLNAEDLKKHFRYVINKIICI